MTLLEGWKRRARNLKREVYALYFACRDPRVRWYAKVLAAGIVTYAFSPIDLIPDFISVLGYLDELVLLPLSIMAVRAMIPGEVLAECRERATQGSKESFNVRMTAELADVCLYRPDFAFERRADVHDVVRVVAHNEPDFPHSMRHDACSPIPPIGEG